MLKIKRISGFIVGIMVVSLAGSEVTSQKGSSQETHYENWKFHFVNVTAWDFIQYTLNIGYSNEIPEAHCWKYYLDNNYGLPIITKAVERGIKELSHDQQIKYYTNWGKRYKQLQEEEKNNIVASKILNKEINDSLKLTVALYNSTLQQKKEDVWKASKALSTLKK